jgi:hypothetical protein
MRLPEKREYDLERKQESHHDQQVPWSPNLAENHSAGEIGTGIWAGKQVEQTNCW